MVKCCWITFGVFLVLGVALIVIGGCLIPYFNARIDTRINRKFELVPGSDSYQTWRDHDGSLYKSYYFLNVTNAEDVIKRHAVPVVSETGPYTYRVNMTRSDVRFGASNITLTYTETKRYQFDSALSVGPENDSVTTVNIPILTLVTWLRDADENVTSTIDKLLTEIVQEHLLAGLTVHDLIWGYRSETLERVNLLLKYTFNITLFNDTMFGVEYQPGVQMGSRVEKFTISTGVKDFKTFMDVLEWNDQSHLKYWTANYSNDIRGTADGTRWKPLLDVSQQLDEFRGDWCRSIYYTASEPTPAEDRFSTDAGVSTWRYSMPRAVLDRSEQNKGFCVSLTRCTDSGVLNVSACRDNYPLMLSQPHFYEAASHYQQDIIGLSPNLTSHQSTVDIELETGEAVQSRRKLQFNAEINFSPAFNETLQFKEGLVFPVVWTEELFNISRTGLKQLESDVKFMRDIAGMRAEYEGIEYGLIGLGAAILVCLCIIALIVCARRAQATRSEVEERQPLLSEQ